MSRKLDIKISDKHLDFLLYLITIKRFDALSLWRVLHKPNENDMLYKSYLKQKGVN
tara:strand:+ start:168 stop:335 length:168 start_codon:yes stop_codon:yes gene_type:complete